MERDERWSPTGTVAAALAIMLNCSAAVAQDQGGPALSAPGVLVSFQGGVVGENVARVLDVLLDEPTGVPTEEYTVAPGDTLCGILDARLYPPPCPPLADIIDRLNPKLRPSTLTLHVGDTLLFPKLRIDRYL